MFIDNFNSDDIINCLDLFPDLKMYIIRCDLKENVNITRKTRDLFGFVNYVIVEFQKASVFFQTSLAVNVHNYMDMKSGTSWIHVFFRIL